MERDLQTLFFDLEITLLKLHFSHFNIPPDLSQTFKILLDASVFSTFMNFILFYMCKTRALKTQFYAFSLVVL